LTGWINGKMEKSNVVLSNLIRDLKTLSSKEDARIWKRVASDLEEATRRRRIVNISRINRYAKKDETVVVPGKVLGTGTLSQKVTVAAFQFSKSAKEKIKEAGSAITIHELIKINPKGEKVRIIG